MPQQYITGGIGSAPEQIGYYVLDGLSPSLAIALSATTTAASTTGAAALAVAVASSATLTAENTTGAIALAVARASSATLTAVSATGNAALAITRAFSATLTAASTTGAVALPVERASSATLTAENATGAVALAVARAASAILRANSDTGSAELFLLLTQMSATLTADSATSAVALAVARAASATLTAESTTGSFTISTGTVTLSATSTTDSTTQAIICAVIRALSATSTAASTTAAADILAWDLHATYAQYLTASELAAMRATQELVHLEMATAEGLAMREVQQMAQPGTAYIQRATLVSDGMGGYTETWATIMQVSARWGVRPNAGRETPTGDQLVSANEWTISIPYDAAVQAKDRIVQVGSNKIYEVTFVPNGQSYQTAIYLQATMLNEETT